MDGRGPLDHLPAGERQQERWQLLPDERHLHDAAVRHRAHDPAASAECVQIREDHVKKLDINQ